MYTYTSLFFTERLLQNQIKSNRTFSYFLAEVSLKAYILTDCLIITQCIGVGKWKFSNSTCKFECFHDALDCIHRNKIL